MLIEPEFVSQIVEMYESGMGQKEIVEKTGHDYSVVRYWLKKKGVYDPSRRAHGSAEGRAKIAQKKINNAENRIAINILVKGYLYLGGYKGKGSTVRIGCPTCGGEFTRYADFHLVRVKIECPICSESAQRALANKQFKEEKSRERKCKQEERRLLVLQLEQEKQIKIDWIRHCKWCGSEFTVRDLAKEKGLDPVFLIGTPPEYCSDKCRKARERKVYGKTGNHRKRAAKYGCKYESGISLHRLIKRDGLRCAICGDMCDINDRSYGNGNGPLYPSIDHIVPISKGGGHTWNNVQIAHIICNILKRDKIDEKYGNALRGTSPLEVR